MQADAISRPNYLAVRYRYRRHGDTETRRHGDRAASQNVTLAPWHLGTLAPWHLGILAPWHLGTLCLVCITFCHPERKPQLERRIAVSSMSDPSLRLRMTGL